jgi:hypothetical protein
MLWISASAKVEKQEWSIVHRQVAPEGRGFGGFLVQGRAGSTDPAEQPWLAGERRPARGSSALRCRQAGDIHGRWAGEILPLRGRLRARR